MRKVEGRVKGEEDIVVAVAMAVEATRVTASRVNRDDTIMEGRKIKDSDLAAA